MRAQSLAAEPYSSMSSSLQPASCRPSMTLSSMSSLCGFDFGGAGKWLFAGTGLGTNERMRLIELFEEVDLGGGESYVERSYGVVDSLGLGTTYDGCLNATRPVPRDRKRVV